jgi:hypothetical protein
VDEVKSTALRGSWKQLMNEIINYLRGFHNQQDEIREIIVLTLKVLGKTVPH